MACLGAPWSEVPHEGTWRLSPLQVGEPNTVPIPSFPSGPGPRFGDLRLLKLLLSILEIQCIHEHVRGKSRGQQFQKFNPFAPIQRVRRPERRERVDGSTQLAGTSWKITCGQVNLTVKVKR